MWDSPTCVAGTGHSPAGGEALWSFPRKEGVLLQSALLEGGQPWSRK